ncbi:hypothetical protein [Streptomyces sp. GESEQ-4]|uniref:hypothetical protein n=1 Tax=Streptomyces sp. GESEQ-4 TaxID=2812655 RepID=UPI001B3226DB|nr:hypothetical protein [Streptomyces sp. GESEQ-4]
MAEDIKVLVERLTARVSTLEGTENFAARFKAQFADASRVPTEFKEAVQGEIAAWKAQQDAAQKPVDAKWVADTVPVTGVKPELTGLNLAGNLVKVEGNFLALQADVIKVDAILKDFALNRMETKRTVEQLKALNLAGQTDTKKAVMDMVDPVNMLKRIRDLEEATKKSVGAMQQQVDGAHAKANKIRELLNQEPGLPRMRRDLVKLEKSAAWAKNRIEKLTGSKDAATDQTKKRQGGKDIPNVQQLERQEKQLRATIVRFVRLVELAAPEMKSFSSQISGIERELQR